ncbi:MAG: flagellar basal body rod protein FlgC [Bacillota bacterium]|jgi:flagellar basal-body rod protein FlgC
MSFLNSLNISGSALTAQKLRMDIISQNIANAKTTRTPEGGPYIKKSVVFRPSEEQVSFKGILRNTQGIRGVEVTEIIENPNATIPVYDPSHPDADQNGYVMMPNINTVEEMIDMMSATRSIEANIAAFNSLIQMANRALEIGR